MAVVYLDNSSTTRPCTKAGEYMLLALRDGWGNPSSLHRLGMEAELGIDAARKAVAQQLRCDSSEIVFTGSGTEANNTAVFGAAAKAGKRGGRIITTAIEHPSVLEAVASLEEKGFEVVRLKPRKNGVISLEELEKALTADTVLVSMMLVNNELGSIQPVKQAAQLVKNSGCRALFHCDAVQAFGKMAVEPKELGVDLLSASGHKVHGPKGVGFLYIKKGVHIRPMLLGGGQEGGMRSSTEPTPAIMGLMGAVEELPDIKDGLEKMRELWQYAAQRLTQTGLVSLNSHEDVLPYILNISVEGYRSETMLHFLEGRDIFVSSGSACAKGEGSYVLRECGFPRSRVDSALRLSFCSENTKEDIDRLVTEIVALTQKLKRTKI